MITHESYFILRTPLFPYHTADLLDIDALKSKFSDPMVKEALYLASSALYAKLDPFLQSALSEGEMKRVAFSLQKYLLRLSCRPTPFGLFSGITKGIWSDTPQTILPASIKRHTRLDTDFVSTLAAAMMAQPEIGDAVKFFPNNTLYAVGNTLRYIEYTIENGRRTYSLSNLDDNDSIRHVLEQARHGKNKRALALSLVNDDIDFEEAYGFVELIIRNQLLTSELEINLTRCDYFSNVQSVLQQHRIPAPVLDHIQKYLTQLDRQVAHENLSVYPALMNTLRQFANPNSPVNYLQVDAYRDGTVALTRNIADTVQDAVETLSGLMAPEEGKTLDDFCKAFYERYEHQTIDLCIALDPEVGVGYPVQYSVPIEDSMLLKDIGFAREKDAVVFTSSDFYKFLLGKYHEAIQHKQPLLLTKDELRPFIKPGKLPSSLYAFVSLHNKTLATGEQHTDVFFTGAYGPSAASLIARFCHLRKDIADDLCETLRREEQNYADAIFAEVVHANEARIGNISTRPVLRPYEIPILARSGVDNDHTVSINDLTLALVGGRLVLRSKKLDREIIPRLSSAHNFSNDTIAAYRFLCDLQYQGIQSSVMWDWGPLKNAPYLPTVKMGNVILSAAKWQLTAGEVEAIAKTDNVKRVVEALRKKHGIPRRVVLGERDNKIPLDLENDSHLPVLQKLVETINVLEESITNEGNLLFRDAAGNGYSNELIVPLANNAAQGHHTPSRTMPLKARRSFALGSEWIYYKIYCNTRASDQVLLALVKPLAEYLLEQGIVDRWFFIRYRDPLNHVRVRFNGKGLFYHTVIAEFQKGAHRLMEAGVISDIQTTTYRREIERYGDENIDTSESLFFLDSESVIQLLAHVDDEDLRWKLGLALVNQWFQVFDMGATEQQAIVYDLRQQFFKEMDVTSAMKRSLADKLRGYRTAIGQVLQGDAFAEPIQEIILTRGVAMRPFAAEILKKQREGTLSVPVPLLLKHYIHLSLNRLLPANPRYHEMVLYDFLFQHYQSQAKRNVVV
ncbi:lantibiotic dehydratase [Chryseolinea lacunae]|uniref:Lantibiotic dehydratase n=1 Tax=Chryseolinea lacunae TaxID=2801331 RepID=A0ABS1KPI8_9BACT|nr:lantibiotic dehydratase [Chryseolinea lacunae]MBL0741374.1 lantibiotic dehydratase [Chryseolinea lacunae]